MNQNKYDAFINSLRVWMDANEDDYYEFEDMMNELPDQGYDSIVRRSVQLLPSFKRLVQKKCNSPENIDLSDIIEVAKVQGLAEKLIGTIDAKNNDNFIPAMLCWLYFGRSWEGMIEHGEAILRRPTTNLFQKIYIRFGLKMLIKSSITNEFRTKKDWDNYSKLRESIESENVINWAMEKSSIGRRASELKPLIEFISDSFNQKQKQNIVKAIAGYMNDNTVDVARHVATMLTALEYHSYLKSYTKRSFYEALRSELNVNIGNGTLINNYLNSNNYDKNLKDEEIERAIRYFTISSTNKK